MRKQVSIQIFLASISIICCRPLLVNHKEDSNLIFISFDGFRWDYMENHTLPNLNKYFVNDGCKVVKGLKNVFSTVTFPNFFTLMTGLFPDSHGNNYFLFFFKHFFLNFFIWVFIYSKNNGNKILFLFFSLFLSVYQFRRNIFTQPSRK